jgi:hydroxymethylpyrimidine/phosphomethylpyrimidine kinase
MPAHDSKTPPVVLSIAGFDPTSGAGVTADIKTIAAHGCYGVACITALTVQSTRGVSRVLPVEPALLANTLNELAEDMAISAVHIGMLGTRDSARAVAAFLREGGFRSIVLDPVLKSSSGAELLDPPGKALLVKQLIPLADVITPNVDEAAALTGLAVTGLAEMKAAAAKLHEMGAGAVVVTGGHLTEPTDVLSVSTGEEGILVEEFTGRKLKSASTHGTGCAFSTSLACHLAQGRSLPEAVRLAKAYVVEAIEHAYPVGRGMGPLNHLFRMGATEFPSKT